MKRESRGKMERNAFVMSVKRKLVKGEFIVVKDANLMRAASALKWCRKRKGKDLVV